METSTLAGGLNLPLCHDCTMDTAIMQLFFSWHHVSPKHNSERTG